MNHHKRPVAEVSTSSMADIAFLLLTFFLMTTVIQNDKGIAIMLPEITTQIIPVHERNLFKVQINSYDQLMVEGVPRKDLNGLRDEIKKFVMNQSKDPSLSENPENAVVTFKTDRGTSYKSFIATLDEIQAAYFEIYGERTGMTADAFRKLDVSNPVQKKIYDQGRKDIPMNISMAEPTSMKQNK